MFYLFMQVLFWIILAFVLGIMVGWWLKGLFQLDDEKTGRAESLATIADEPIGDNDKGQQSVPTESSSVTETAVEELDQHKPVFNEISSEDADDLKRIKGIGAVIEKTLNRLGIFTFQQIAELTPENVKWVEEHLSFSGRITREEWVSQAKKLAEGEDTEFSKRVDHGDVSYDKKD